MRKLNIFSGCTQYGSEIKAFRDNNHNITTLGIEGNVDIKMDIRDFHTTEHYDFMSFHPPCTEFSKANWRLGKCKDRKPDMSIVDACFRIIQETKPIYYLIENPQGCLRHYIGKPDICIKYGDYGHYCQKPTDLWCNIPPIKSMVKNTVIKGVHNKTAFSIGCSKADQRSIVPYELSKAICRAIENVLLKNT